jgi:hypothetical protein
MSRTVGYSLLDHMRMEHLLIYIKANVCVCVCVCLYVQD